MPISEVTTESASRLDRKRARNRHALVAAARRLFSEGGAEATTIAAITEAADLGFGTFYRYFPDKEAILAAVLDTGHHEINAVLSHMDDDQATAAEALRSLTTRFAQAVRRNHDVLTLVWQVGVRGEAPGSGRVRPEQLPPDRSIPALMAGAIRRIIDRGMASGEFAQVDAALVSRFISSTHMYLFSPAAMNVSEQKLIDALCDFELRALTEAGARVPARRGGRKSQ
ncbi:MAG: TetR/AcrR family transcriptional regulator [Chloroflexota bacterium]|nr:TetR/AcrR family transcriptional regulator [Chloroflexota bacterium]